MALEPTEEQLRAISGAIVDAVGVDIIDVASPAAVAHAAWPTIRDQVLEEAAKACFAEFERERREYVALNLPGGTHRAQAFLVACEAIRAMKGTP